MNSKAAKLLIGPHGTPIEESSGWTAKREEIRTRVTPYLGTPEEIVSPVPEYRILDRFKENEIEHLKIEYQVEADEPVRAYLLLPPEERRKNGAAMLCLHGTSPDGKEGQIGRGTKPRRDYARYLAERGYITLAPDHLAAGERIADGEKAFDTARFYQKHPRWSAVGKAIWDGRRALDILERIEGVDSRKIGAVGHSLGGHGSMFLAAFDERVAAAVSSCGLAVWQNNPQRLQWAREEWYVYFPALRKPFQESETPPFDLHELAALIAPRPFLNLSGLGDPMYGNNEALGEAGFELHQVYSLLGHGERVGNFLFGGGHEVPEYGRALTAAWFDRWLVDGELSS